MRSSPAEVATPASALLAGGAQGVAWFVATVLASALVIVQAAWARAARRRRGRTECRAGRDPERRTTDAAMSAAYSTDAYPAGPGTEAGSRAPLRT